MSDKSTPKPTAAAGSTGSTGGSQSDIETNAAKMAQSTAKTDTANSAMTSSPSTSGSTGAPTTAGASTPSPSTPASASMSSTTKSDADKSAKELASETAEAAKARAKDVAENAKAEASAMADKAKETAYGKAEEAKGYASSEIERTAESVRAAGREFGEDSYPAQAAEYLATGLHDAADAIRRRDVGSLVDDVSQFARRNPAVFLGAAAVLGFAAARMMKASERNDYGSYDPYSRPSAREMQRPTPGVAHTPHAHKTAAPTRPNGGYSS